MSRPAKIRDDLLLALLGVLGLVVFMQSGMIRLSPAVFTWSFLPLPSLILSGIVGLLLVSAAVFVVWAGTSRLATVTAVMAFVSAPLLLAESRLTVVTFWVMAPSVLAFDIATLVASTRSDRARAVVMPWILTIVTGLAVTVGALAFFVMEPIWGDMAEETVIIDARSPDSLWTMTGIERNEGAFGGSTSIEVHRTWFGLVKTSRSVYQGEWGADPAARWVNWHTIGINGQEFDLYWDSAPHSDR